MHLTPLRGLPKPPLRLVWLGLAVLLSACQLVAPPAPPQPRLLLNQPTDGSNQAQAPAVSLGSANRASPPAVTYTIQRGTLSQSMSISGRVVPARSAQLTLRGGGTVTAVYVKQGQAVKQGDTLVEFALDDESLQAAKGQATLAELAAESQEARVTELKAGANQASVAQLQATVQSDLAAIQKLDLERDGLQASTDRAAQTQQVARDAADRKVALAEVSLQAAQDALADAQAAAKHAHDNAQIEQEQTTANQDQVRAEAQAAADTATAAVRTADRRVQQAALKLRQAQLEWAGTKADQERAIRQLAVDQDREALKDAQALEQGARDQSPTTDHTKRQIAAEINAAAAGTRTAERTLVRDTLALDQVQATLPAARSTDDADIRQASIALDQSKDDLAQAQAAQQRAQQKLDSLNKNSTKPRPRADAGSPDAADAAVRQAQHRVETDTLNLQEAQAAQAAQANAGSSADPAATFAGRSLDAARAQLNADQARLDEQQNGAPDTTIQREQTRASLLRDQADKAAAAAQPIIQLTAPFDANVTDVGVNPGQTIAPAQASNVAVDSAPAAIAGQTSDGRTVAVRLAGNGASSIIATASESDVGQLNVGQPVDVSFPGLSGQVGSGTIAEIGGAATSTNNGVTYPVRIDVAQIPPTVKLGMSAQAKINLDAAQDVLFAPRSTIRTVDGQQLVSRVDADQVRDVAVQLGRTYGSDVELLSGVREGDVVAIYSAPTFAPKPSP